MATEPLRQWNAETGLAPIHDFGRQVAARHVLEHALAVTQRLLERLGQRTRQIDDFIVEERHARLEARGHAHLVLPVQDRDEVGLEVELRNGAVHTAMASERSLDQASPDRQRPVRDRPS